MVFGSQSEEDSFVQHEHGSCRLPGHILGCLLQNPKEMDLNVLWSYLQQVYGAGKCSIVDSVELARLDPGVASPEAVGAYWVFSWFMPLFVEQKRSHFSPK